MILTQNHRLDHIFRLYEKSLGKDYLPYRNHCYRLLNYVVWYQRDQANVDFLATVIGFHDLAIWTHQTMDYLLPSVQLAQQYCQQEALSYSSSLLTHCIVEHHRLSASTYGRVPEYLRRADLVDLSFGLFRHGLSQELVSKSKEVWPYRNFQKIIFRKVMWHALGHPGNPFPMLKW